MVCPQRREPVLLLDEYVVKVQIEQVTHGGQVEQVIPYLCLKNLAAVLAELTVQMGLHESPEVAEIRIGGNALLPSLDRDTTACCDRFCHCPVDPGIRFLELGRYIEDTAVPDEQITYGLLEAVTKKVLHVAVHSSSPGIEGIT